MSYCLCLTQRERKREREGERVRERERNYDDMYYIMILMYWQLPNKHIELN